MRNLTVCQSMETDRDSEANAFDLNRSRSAKFESGRPDEKEELGNFGRWLLFHRLPLPVSPETNATSSGRHRNNRVSSPTCGSANHGGGRRVLPNKSTLDLHPAPGIGLTRDKTQDSLQDNVHLPTLHTAKHLPEK